MSWRLRLIALCFSAAALSGCSSLIKVYDSTFTGMSSHAASYDLADYRLTDWQPSMRLGQNPGEKRYFIEFRARNALSYGHASVVFGRLDSNGRVPVDRNGVLIPGAVEISGLHPATTSNVAWSTGHLVPVPAETGPSDGDFEDAYITARYRIDLTEEEFRKVVEIVRQHKKAHQLWYAPVVTMNCIGYIGSIAKEMGLRVPLTPKMPKEFVNSLKAMNS